MEVKAGYVAIQPQNNPANNEADKWQEWTSDNIRGMSGQG
jgi:hypothetical protein